MLLGALMLAAVIGGAAFGIVKWNRAAREEWRMIAAELGMELAPRSLSITGKRDGHIVIVARHYDSESSYIQVRVRSLSGIPSAMRIEPAGPSRILIGDPIVLTGDEAFDARVRVRGEEVFVLASLSVSGRSAVRELLSLNGSVLGGDVVINSASRQAVVADVDAAIRVARVLAFDLENPGARLLENLRVETLPGPRLRFLDALKSEHVSSSAREWAIQIGLKHDDPRLRAQAALLVGPAAAHLLEAIVIDREAPDELRSRLLQHLASIDRVPAMETCVTMLDRAGPSTTIALLGLLGKNKHAGAEPQAIALLGHVALEVQLAAVETLAEIGTAASVEPLKELGGILDRELKRGASRAIEKIRSRLGFVDTGRLSIAGEQLEHGGLSIASAEGGALGLVKDPPAK